MLNAVGFGDLLAVEVAMLLVFRRIDLKPKTNNPLLSICVCITNSIF